MKFARALCLIFYCSLGLAEVGGYIKLFADAPTGPRYFQLRNSTRFFYQDSLLEGTDISLHYQLNPSYRDRKISRLTTEVENYRVDDIKTDPVTEDNVDLTQNLDRVLLKQEFEKFDLIVGRQAITFGLGRIAASTDVFLPFSYGSIDTEYKAGIDAIRIQYALGDFSELDFGLVAGKSTNGFIRGRTQLLSLDIEALLGEFQRRKFSGMTLQGSVGNYGVWYEQAMVFEYKNSNAQEASKYYQRWSLGIERLISDKLSLFAEFHNNGAGESKKEDYSNNLSKFAYRSKNVFFLGQQYFSVGAGWQPYGLLTTSHFLLLNANDQSTLIVNRGEYSLAENQYLEFHSLVGFGDRNSEFHLAQDQYSVVYKYYW